MSKEKPIARKQGRPQTLTTEIARKLHTLWMMAGDSMTDKEICGCFNLTFEQLTGWLDKPQVKVDIGNGQQCLRAIRTNAKNSTKATYLQGIQSAITQAKDNEDPANILKGYFWLLEKQFPKEFGNRQKIEHAGGMKVEIDESKLEAAYAKIRKIEKEYEDG